MGGGNEDNARNKQACQICEEESHKADMCPWIYSKCSKPSYSGIMILSISEIKSTYEKKYLKCQYDTCDGMQWLEEAIALKNECKQKKNTYGASSSTPEGYFECGEIGHWVKNCHWKETKCPSGCQGTRKLWTSKFLKCINCGHFEWLEAAKSRKVNVRVKPEVDLDDICNKFDRKFNY